MVRAVKWRAQPGPNGIAAWTADEAEALLLRKVMKDLGLKTKLERDRCEYYTLHSIRVIGDTSEVLRGREIRRGFKVAMSLRGDVYDFLEGLRAGLIEAERVGIIRTEKPHAVAKTSGILRAGTHPMLPAPKEENRA